MMRLETAPLDLQDGSLVTCQEKRGLDGVHPWDLHVGGQNHLPKVVC